jgi:hypothetical protein
VPTWLRRIYGGPPPRPSARRLTAAVSENDAALADTARSFLAFWRGDACNILRKEEEVLLPVLACHEGDLGEPTMRMLAQHVRIRGIVMDWAMRFSGVRRDQRPYEASESS